MSFAKAKRTLLHYATEALYGELFHVNDSREKTHTYYYPDGKIKTVQPFLSDQLHGTVLLYWPNGSLKRKTEFSQGKRMGWDRIWNEWGQLIDEGEYETGAPVNTHSRWSEKGVLIEKVCFLKGIVHELWRWNDEGELVYTQCK